MKSLSVSSQILCFIGAVLWFHVPHGLGQTGLDYMPPGDASIVDAQLPDARFLQGGIRFFEKEAGDGAFIEKGDRVTALYIGRLVDGTIFNQKQSRFHTFRFEVGAEPRQIIEGWEKAMPLMQNGGTYMVAIPSQFAYKSKGRRGQVPPYTTVVFEIEILEVDKRSKL